MERLTIEYNEQYVPKKLCAINRFNEADDCDSCGNYCEECESGCDKCGIQECFNQLGAYENTNLTPEQFKEIDKLYTEQSKELGRYKDIEKWLCEHYKANVTLLELAELFLKTIETVDGEEIKGCRILTNRDAEEWDAYKQRIEELQKYRNIGTLEECLGYKIHGKGIDVDKVIEQLEENVENITDKNGVHHFAVPVSTATYIVKRGCLDEIAGKEKGEHK